MNKLYSIIVFLGAMMVFSFAIAMPYEKTLKEAKKEAKYFSSPSVKPRKKTDDSKYICLTSGSGKEYVDRKDIALDLFEQAVGEGSGEAAFILFCYYSLGRYENKTISTYGWNTKYDGDITHNQLQELHFDKGMTFLQKAVDMNFQPAFEFLLLKNSLDSDKESMAGSLKGLYDARNGDPEAQMWIAFGYRSDNPDKYEYWINRSIEQKNWPLWARTNYANYLLDCGRKQYALKVLEPAKKKTKYYDDRTAKFGMHQEYLFYIADAVYSGNREDALNWCDAFYKSEQPYDIEVYVKLRDWNLVEAVINYLASNRRKDLYKSIYALNVNVSDPELLSKRGERYEVWGDSIKAYENYKRAALGKDFGSTLKVLEYSSKGFALSKNDSEIILSEIMDKNQQTVTAPPFQPMWRLLYLLAQFFYNPTNESNDFELAAKFYMTCVNQDGTPDVVKADCAKQLFKCFSFGRGVDEDHETADKWLNYAKSLGDADSKTIYEVLFPKEESIHPYQ